LGELSTDEVVDMLSEISDAEEFPDLVIDWFDLIENYLEARHQSEWPLQEIDNYRPAGSLLLRLKRT
jgi:hypothetical protein